MKSLWSRAQQAHRCGCRSCSTAASSFSKRPNIARRKPTFAEVFTAAYSSVFATAAVIDAVAKEKRRSEIDKQIKEARIELHNLIENDPSNSALSKCQDDILKLEQMDPLWANLKEIYKNRPYMKEIHRPAEVSASELLDTLRTDHYRSKDIETLRAGRALDYGKLEQTIMWEEADSNTESLVAQTDSHLNKEADAARGLIDKISSRVARMDDNSSSTASCPTLVQVRSMLGQEYPKYLFRSIDSQGAMKNTLALNRHIRQLLNDPNLCLQEKVGRVCYNLLVSAYPPDIHTYNTLIVSFDKLGYGNLSSAVVKSFFFERMLKPTPSTFAAILNHYKCNNDHGRFFRMIALITGLDSMTGAKIRRRHIDDIQQSPLLTKWAEDKRRRTTTGSWVWEHGTLSLPVAQEVINSLLHFSLFHQAATFLILCLKTGINLSGRVLHQVLDECIYALDWKGAVQILRGFTFFNSKLKEVLAKEPAESRAYIIDRIRVLHDLVGIDPTARKSFHQRLKQLGIYKKNYAETKKMIGGFELATETLHVNGRSISRPAQQRSESKLLSLESLWKEYVYVRKTTISIESKLLQPELGYYVRNSMALKIGEAALQRSQDLSLEFAELVPMYDLEPAAVSESQPLERQGQQPKLPQPQNTEEFADWRGANKLHMLAHSSDPSAQMAMVA